MQRLFVTAVLAISIHVFNLRAQATAPAPNPSATPSSASAPAAAGLMLREGTEVHLTFAEDLNSKTAMAGDPVVLLLDADLKADGIVVAKAGSTAYAVVTQAEKSTKMGKAGRLDIRLDYLKAGSDKVRLSGAKGKEGDSGIVALTERFGPLGFIKHGNIDIKQGTSLTAYVAHDIALPPAA